MKLTSLISAILFAAAFSMLGNIGSTVLASNPKQAPTNEPIKAPYVFPTPIFIPTYTTFTDPPSSPGGTTAASQPAAPASIQGTYTVQPGDSPWVIARKVYGRGDKYPLILQANGLTESSTLRVGAVLRIPPADTVVQAIPTPAPTIAPTEGAPQVVTSLQPTAAAPTRTPTPATPKSQDTSVTTMLSTAIMILSVVLFLAAIATALLAVLVYRRSTRLDRMTNRLRKLKDDKP